MKKNILIFALLLLSIINFAQGVAINTDGSNPDASAILDVKSTDMGILFPRMTESQRDAISTPTDGLIIFNIETGCVNYYFSGDWYESCGDIISAYTCEFSEDFTGLNTLPIGWTTSHPLQWTISATDYAGGTSSELEFYYSDFVVSQFTVTTDEINMSSCNNLELIFDYYVNWYEYSFTLRVQTSTDGISFTDRASQTVTSDIAATSWTVDLSAVDGEIFYLRFVFDGDEFNIFGWYIDNILITGN
jgi:hypothetical protein